MGFVRTPYVASKKLYAFGEPKTEELYWPGGRMLRVYIPSVWTVTKKGIAQVSKGIVSTTLREDEITTFDDAWLAALDSRYGGSPEARWDGEFMWAPETPLARMVELSQELEPLRQALPDVPAGYHGWYRQGR